MSLRDEIAASYQQIVLQVFIAGRQVPLVVGADVSMGLSQINAQATIHLTERPDYAVEGASCEVWAGYNSATAIIFRGELTGSEWSHFPGVVSLPARDVLARTRMEWGGDDREYASQDDAAIIRNLLEAMGIPSSSAHIESSSWTMGVVEVVSAPSGRAFWPLIEEIDNLAGYRTFTDRAGVVRRYRVSGNVGTGSNFDYAEGDNIIKATRRRTVEGIVNKCIVTGITYEGLAVGGPDIAQAQADNPFIPDPPRYVGPPIQSNLVEDDAKALEIAQRVVSDKNRRPEIFELEVIGNPLLEPLSIINITHAALETGSSLFVVDRVQHTIRGASFRTSITTLGGNINATVSNISPIAAFDVKLFQEGADTGAGVTSLITGIADGSASNDPDGTSVTYGWVVSVDAGSVTPTTGALSVMRFAITGAATALTVTLTVTDAGSATGVLTRVIPLDGTTMLVEPLYTAEGTIIAATADGEQTWNTYTIPSSGSATCLCPFGPSWGMIWGTSTGHIYVSLDKLATTPVDTGAPHGAVACTAVWVNEVDATRAWAGFSDGKVYSGVVVPTTGAITWTLAGTVTGGPPIVEIRESVGALGDLRVTAGASYYHSADGGASWSILHTFDTAWRMAAGFDLNIASGLNDAAPLYEEGGATPTVPGGVTHIRGISFGWRTKELYATDNTAALYTTDDTLAAFTLHADALPAIGNHLIRSGNADRVVYIACGDGTGTANGAVKWIPGTKAPWYIRKTTARKVHMIGYGNAGPPPGGPFELLMLPYGASGADDKIWHYSLTGWAGITPPRAGWYWQCLAVNPQNQDEWLLYGVTNTSRWSSAGSDNKVYGDNGGADNTIGTYSPLWRSTDAGATWAEVVLTITGSNKDHIIVDRALCWSDDAPGVWWMQGYTVAYYNETFLWRGTSGSSGTFHRQASAVWVLATSGADGEFIVSSSDSAYLGQTGNLYYLSSTFTATNVTQATGDTPSNQWLSIDRLPGSRNVVGYRTGTNNVWGVSDYRVAGMMAAICASNGTSVSAGWAGLYTSGTGIEFIASPFAGGTPATVTTDTSATNYCRVGRRRRLTVAAVRTDKALIVWDGAAGRSIASPPSSDLAKVAAFVEVIEL